jgi:hypothetical protein
MPFPSPSNARKITHASHHGDLAALSALEQRTLFAQGRPPLTSKDRMHCKGQRATGRSLTTKDNETRQGYCPFDDTRFIHA